MTYFVRYTSNAQADLERGFSFVGYMLLESKMSALDNIADLTGAAYEDEGFDLSTWAEDNAHLVGQDNVTGKWGQKRSGLCGYGPFESIEDARAAISDGRAEGTVSGGPGAIFVGVEVFNADIDGQDEGVTFRPSAIVEVFDGR